MAYRIRYQLFVDWVTPGMGLGLAESPLGGPGMIPAGNAQTIGFFNTSNAVLPPTSSTFTSTDITNLLNSMTTDLSAQMTAQIGRIQNFASSGG